MAKILIIDDDIDICQLLERFLKRKGYDAQFFTSGKKALEVVKEEKVDLVFCDFRLPDGDGREFLQKIKSISKETHVIIITGYSDIKVAVDVMKLGALDYVTKPLLPEEILMMVERSLKEKPQDNFIRSEETTYSQKSEPVIRAINNTAPDKKNYIVGKSKESQNIQRQIQLVAPTNYSVIIYGESGTGKEQIAYEIHSLSGRKDKPFVAVDCGSLTKELAGSELFGHEKGSFTGAMQTKIGQFELANGGTIFLDEIANLPYDVQVSLLRVIQERKIRRIGSQKEINVEVRIIVASNEKLNELAANGKFRDDLFHRFNEFSISLLPLRERNKDLMLFADFFLESANAELGKGIEGFDEEVQKVFSEYNWPGNLRELNNVIKRATLLANKTTISLETLPPEIVFQSKFNLSDDRSENHLNKINAATDLKSVALNAECDKILETLRKVNFNKSKAAKLLNIDRKTLYNKMKSFNLLTE